MKAKKGTVYLDGKAIEKQPTKEIAKKMAILPQTAEVPTGLTVFELVSYGRFPHQKGFGTLKEEDYRYIHWALEVTGMTEFANRPAEHYQVGNVNAYGLRWLLHKGQNYSY